MKVFFLHFKNFAMFFVTLCTTSHAETSRFFLNHQNIRGTHQLEVIYEKDSIQPDLLASLVRNSLSRAEALLKTPLRDDLQIYADNEALYHNGLATVIPQNRIFVNLWAPSIESSIGLSNDYLLETLTHEFAHILSLQPREGIFKVLSWIVGNTSRPNGAWPRWIHEGLAVWVESALGGRGHSGVRELDLRRYAEYYQRHQKHPISSSSLSGDRSEDENKYDESDSPYHFGSLFIARLFAKLEEQQRGPDAFIHESSASLGLSFRKSFKSLGIDVDQEFQAIRESWAQTPLGPVKEHKKVHRNENINGPFGWNSVAWVEYSPQSTDYRILSESKERFKWSYDFEVPMQAFWDPINKRFVILVFSRGTKSSDPGKTRIVVFSARGKELCTVQAHPRIREIFFHPSQQLGWIQVEPNGLQLVRSARLLESCELSELRELTKGREPFERLSGLYVDPQRYLLSRSKGRNSFREELDLNGKLLALPGVYSAPRPWAQCSAPSECFLVQEYARDYTGPAVLSLINGDLVQKQRLPLKTGAAQSALTSEGKFYTLEKFWDFDELNHYEAMAFDPTLTGTKSSPPSPTSLNTDESVSETKYNALPSLIPHFFIPSFGASNEEFILAASTFYSDMPDRYRGSTTLGYYSEIGKPFILSNFERRKLEWGPFHELQFHFEYDTRQIGTIRFQRMGAGSTIEARWQLGSKALLSLKSGAQGLYSEWALNNQSTFVIPELSANLQSAGAGNPNSAQFRLSKSTFAYSLLHRSRWIKKADFYERVHLQSPFFRSGLLITLEHASTSANNFPVSYFEWGGLGTFSTFNQSFLARGFPVSRAIGSEVFRASLENAFALSSIDAGFSWNRLRLRNLDLNLVAETLSYRSYNGEKSLERPWFTSFGTEAQLFLRVLGYVNSKFSAGVYKGLGPWGEYRVALNLKTSVEP